MHSDQESKEGKREEEGERGSPSGGTIHALSIQLHVIYLSIKGRRIRTEGISRKSPSPTPLQDDWVNTIRPLSNWPSIPTSGHQGEGEDEEVTLPSPLPPSECHRRSSSSQQGKGGMSSVNGRVNPRVEDIHLLPSLPSPSFPHVKTTQIICTAYSSSFFLVSILLGRGGGGGGR